MPSGTVHKASIYLESYTVEEAVSLVLSRPPPSSFPAQDSSINPEYLTSGNPLDCKEKIQLEERHCGNIIFVPRKRGKAVAPHVLQILLANGADSGAKTRDLHDF
ncbi:hypothetical protein Tco_0773978 [Tanacetum coccineum]|uniref:Uncharacterized protein n=1 Tax=Tanacetum coccineum TaxID=301880 RepID=A0ABQ4ZQ81_9ASTR